VSGRPTIAKLTRPTLRDIEPRRRLFQRLDELRRESPAVWIGAPAGSGKTSLAVSYIDEKKAPVLWYRIDERDRHVTELFFYLRLTSGGARDGEPSLSLELPVFSNGADVARFARRFFEALFQQLPAGAIVVFDDYHSAVVGPEWQAVFEHCLASIPDGLNVLVLSRQSPPGTLARARAHGELGVLESSELLLTEQETAALAKRRLGKKRKLAAEELTQIHAATSGWAAGVSLLLRSNPGGNLAAFSGRSAGPLFDYLSNAVFSELSPSTQTLLLHSACLRCFKIDELETLAGSSADRNELLGLYRSGFFLESEGDSEEVFRFHPMFRSFLAYRAEQVLGADASRALRGRAARLLQQVGRAEEAFELHLQNSDQRALSELVLSLAPTLFAQGRSAMLQEWITALDPAKVEASSWLSYWQAGCLIATEPSRSLTLYERALGSFIRDGDGSGAYLAWAGAVQALVFEQRSFHLMDSWLQRLSELEQLSPSFASPEVGSAVVGSLLMGLTLSGADNSVLEQWSARAMTLAEKASDPSVRVLTASALVLNAGLRGDVEQAGAWFAALQRYSGGPTTLIGRISALAAGAKAAWNQGELGACIDAAHQGLALLGQDRVPMWQLALFVFGCIAAAQRGAKADADCFLAKLAEMAASGAPLEVSGYHVARAHCAAAVGEFKRARTWIELSVDLDRSVGFAYGLGVDSQAAAYFHFKVGDEAGGREALRGARGIEDAHRNVLLRYFRLWLEADLALKAGQPEQAAALLREVSVIGREKQLFNMYVPEPARVAEICRFALAHDIEPEYVRTLVRRKELFKHLAPVELTSWPWPIQIRTFGGLEVRVDDEPLALGRARLPLQLLQLLTTDTGNRTGLPVSRVLDSLWPDADADNATHNFDMTVLRLRNQLGEQGRNGLRVERGRALLDPALCWTDTAALSALLGEIGALEPEAPGGVGQVERYSALCARLEALYRGPFADRDDGTPALCEYGERVRARVAVALRSLSSRLTARGARNRAETLRERLLDADPGLVSAAEREICQL
jgi:DNA-binding SARP family transcriptional activator